MYSRETEIRHLASKDVSKLSVELEQSWEKLMRIIPNDLSILSTSNQRADPPLTKYTNDHIKMIERASQAQDRSPTEILLDEWGTSGRIRPNLGNLFDLLVRAELFRGADLIATDFLNEPPPPRPQNGPAAKIDISIPLQTEEINRIEGVLNDASYPGTNTINENAQVDSELNNKDFYEKFGKCEKNVEIEYSDLIKFSSSTIPTTSSDIIHSSNIPNVSDLLETRNIIFINDQECYRNGQTTENMEDEENIPNSSDLNVPEISALNIGTTTEEYTSNNSRSGSFGNSSSLSTNTDEDGNYTPNLSILDQRSNDDSSLTNITDTSENISFDNDNVPNNETTTDINNVPCLNDLNTTQ